MLAQGLLTGWIDAILLSDMPILLCKEDTMAASVSVKVSSRYQVAVPQVARKKLSIRAGDRLLVDVQDGLLILLPEPRDYAVRLAGLHKEIWEGLDTTRYLQEERDAWDASPTG
jgi:AbrB family looped-hinge helix DNA binding protein